LGLSIGPDAARPGYAKADDAERLDSPGLGEVSDGDPAGESGRSDRHPPPGVGPGRGPVDRAREDPGDGGQAEAGRMLFLDAGTPHSLLGLEGSSLLVTRLIPAIGR
jgi:hypothetical protein